jgi:hypothetical protein
MQVGQFPASAANSLIEGYCEDFVSFASVLAQTLEQIAMRGIPIDRSREHLARIEKGMRDLSSAIHELVERSTSDGMPALQEGRRLESARAVAPAGALVAAGATAKGLPAGPQADAVQGLAANSEGFNGNSDSMPLRSVLQFLGRTRRAGFVRVLIGDEQLMFEVQNGCLVAATSNICLPQERLDLLLIERGASTPADLAPILDRIPAAQSERFAEAVVAAGVVTEGQIYDALALQQNRRYSRACRSQSVTYQFFDGVRKQPGFRLLPPPMPLA